MNHQYKLWILAFLVFSLSNAQEIAAPKFGNGILNLKGKDSTWSMKLGMNLQFQGVGEWEEPGSSLSEYTSNFLIRRARLKFSGFVYSPKLTYKLTLGLSNRDMSGASVYTSNAPRYILDAYMVWNFYGNFELWFGQAKLPGNREHLTSSGNLQLVDRSLLDKSYNIDRDLGVQLRHHFKLSSNFMVREAFALSKGEGRNVTSDNFGRFQYTSRVEVLPFGEFTKKGDYVGGDLSRETHPKLAIGVTYDFNKDAVKTRSNQGVFMITDSGLFTTDISTVFVDAMFKYRGFSFMAEYADRTAKDPIAKNIDGSLTGDRVQIGTGWNLQSGYVFPKAWEVSGRYTNISFDVNTSYEVQDHYTIGVSKYLVGHQLKVQSDISYLTLHSKADQLMWRLQFNVHF